MIDNAMSMVRGKSPPSELTFNEKEVEQFFSFLREFEKRVNLFLSKYHFVVFIHVYFKKYDKSLQCKSLNSMTLKSVNFIHKCN